MSGGILILRMTSNQQNHETRTIASVEPNARFSRSDVMPGPDRQGRPREECANGPMWP